MIFRLAMFDYQRVPRYLLPGNSLGRRVFTYFGSRWSWAYLKMGVWQPHGSFLSGQHAWKEWQPIGFKDILLSNKPTSLEVCHWVSEPWVSCCLTQEIYSNLHGGMAMSSFHENPTRMVTQRNLLGGCVFPQYDGGLDPFTNECVSVVETARVAAHSGIVHVK